MEKNRISAEYLHALQSIYHLIDSRGILVNQERLEVTREYIDRKTKELCNSIGNYWGVSVYVGSLNKPDVALGRSINLNASSGANTVLAFLRDEKDYKIPKVNSRDEEGNFISKESLNELALQKIYSTNQFNILGGDPAIRDLLKIRELTTLKSRYINANLFHHSSGDNLFLTNYNVAGTVTGRRGSRKHSFGFGGNAQNFPKHGELAKIYRRCLVARPGKIFLFVDQIQAEDWPTSALAQNNEALFDLQNSVDRHRKLACAIFGLPWDHYSESEWKESLERYLGKKTRHANNYGMRGNTMSDALAKEGHSLTPAQCQAILDIVNKTDPNVENVFHKYIRECLHNERLIRTPTGRERYFFGLRAGDKGNNSKIYNEGYSYIPQSVVGDNTGFTVFELETTSGFGSGFIVQEGHDSITQELSCDCDVLWDQLQRTRQCFSRIFRFHNGIEIEIPVEGEIGFDFATTITLKNLQTGSKKLEDIRYTDLQAALHKLEEAQEIERVKECGSCRATGLRHM